MRIAVASGKGGTGKTTVATSLALSLVADQVHIKPAPVAPMLLDCDVEAPNAHLFLKPAFDHRQNVVLLIPAVDETKCTHCGKCAEVCQYHAIAVLGQQVLVFPQLCHGCGSCTLMCPEHAITEVPNVMGMLESGPTRDGVILARGVMNVGEPMATPIIRQLKKMGFAPTGTDRDHRRFARHIVPGRRVGTRGRFLAAGHRADTLRVARSATGGAGGARIENSAGRGAQSGWHWRSGRGRVL
jgi:MinD superfamily P-loop ATPase